MISEQTGRGGDIIPKEILQVCDRDKYFRLAKEALDPLDFIHLGGKTPAIKATTNLRFLRSRCITIRKFIDMLIGSGCIEQK